MLEGNEINWAILTAQSIPESEATSRATRAGFCWWLTRSTSTVSRCATFSSCFEVRELSVGRRPLRLWKTTNWSWSWRWPAQNINMNLLVIDKGTGGYYWRMDGRMWVQIIRSTNKSGAKNMYGIEYASFSIWIRNATSVPCSVAEKGVAGDVETCWGSESVKKSFL